MRYVLKVEAIGDSYAARLRHIARTPGYQPRATDDRIAATIRHNRARGRHQVQAMSEIVVELSKRNWSEERIGKELGMEPDEVLRLKQISGLAEMFADREFSEAWEVDLNAQA